MTEFLLSFNWSLIGFYGSLLLLLGGAIGLVLTADLTLRRDPIYFAMLISFFTLCLFGHLS